MKKLLILVAVAFACIGDSQDSKLNYNVAIRTDSVSFVVGYDLFEVEDFFGMKGVSFRARTLGGVSNLGASVTGGGDVVLSGAIGKNAIGSAGVGFLMLAGKKTAPCITFGVKIFAQPEVVAGRDLWLKL